MQAQSLEAMSTASACYQLPLQLQFCVTSKHGLRNSFLICLANFKTPWRLLLLPLPLPFIARPNASASNFSIRLLVNRGAPTTELPVAVSATSLKLFSNLYTAHAARISFYGNVVRLDQWGKQRVVKEVKLANPSGVVVRLEHHDKSRVVKEIMFTNPSGNVIRLEHDAKSRVLKEIKFPNASGNVVRLEQ